MYVVWSIEVENTRTNSYRIRNVMGQQADDIKIERAGGGDPLVIPGPVDFEPGNNTFSRELEPGDYTISWHPTPRDPDNRASVSFTIPLADPARVFLQTVDKP
ncbi:MAG: hypothetical protein JWR37_2572 [Mycobacterium sp.]|jgi:hypothetical protein|nr:hypothetical protein [Mycobacterium sp.]